ncbi:MAG: CDP-alcohol phosphatidyltransferase family protein [Henriciella sp.]|nr:CDP-alcohol phosphatidyltransferase family protein [Henriciella sp.]
MSWKWLPNALTILRCLLAFVVGWSILELEPAAVEFVDEFTAWQLDVSTSTSEERLEAHQARREALRVYSLHIVQPFVWFVLAALTDFFDGLAARRLNAISRFGSVLDPIADKLLVAICLLALADMTNWSFPFLIPVLLIVIRDAAVTLLRWMSNRALPVTVLAKWKTAVEMVGIGGVLLGLALGGVPGLVHGMILFDPRPVLALNSGLGFLISGLSLLGYALIWLAALLSAYTGWLYARAAFSPRSKQ